MNIDQFEFSGTFDELTRSEEQQKQKNQSKIFPGHFFAHKNCQKQLISKTSGLFLETRLFESFLKHVEKVFALIGRLVNSPTIANDIFYFI